MARFALILAVVLAIGTPMFAQQSQTSPSPQPPSAHSRLLPSPKLIPPGLGRSFAEPIPSWNIHGHAELIPNLVARPLEAGYWKNRQPAPLAPSLPRVEKAAATERPQTGATNRR
jgi:hypothetical protein